MAEGKKMRNRSEVCPHCGNTRELTLDMGTGQVSAKLPPKLPRFCWNRRKCIEEMRDKAKLGAHEDGKTRVR